ncbi:MAG: PAS domain S-box protein [Anaerolineae bacterium]|nr:PAS domain S-box protein [Anaerolineae bacterium]
MTANDPAWLFLQTDGQAMPVEAYPVNLVLTGHKPLHQYIVGIPRPNKPLPRWALANAFPVYSNNNQLSIIIVTYVDISERMQIEAALQESQARLAAIIDSAMDAIITVDDNQRIVLFNPAAETMFGLPASEALGQPLARFIPPRFRQAHRQHLKVFAQTGVTSRRMGELGEVSGLRADGSAFPIEASISQGQIQGQKLLTAILRDVSERKAAEALLQRYADRLELLRHIDKAILTAQSANETARATLDNLQSLIPYHRANISLFDFERGEGVTLVERMAARSDPSPDRRFPLAPLKQTIELLKQQPEQVLTGPVLQSLAPDVWQRLEAEGAQSFLGTPLTVQGALLGGLVFLSTAPDAFTAEHAAIVREVGDQIAIALQNAQLSDRFRRVVTSISDHIYMTEVTAAGHYKNLYLSPNVEALTGYPPDKFLTDWTFWSTTVIHPEDRAVARKQREQLCQGHAGETQYRLIQADGTVIWVRDSARVEQRGGSQFIYGVVSDITKQRQLEEQLHQAQKMEAIGQLAGGVAHDFNNLLTVITGVGQMMLDGPLDDENALRQDIEQIIAAADRATALTRHLLIFSRKQVLHPHVLDLNTLVSNLTKMLTRMIGENIHLTTYLDPHLGRVKMDPGQVDQIIINLAINARDAMPEGGQLTVETANVELDSAYAQRHFEVVAGSYVMLAISDSGHGMDTATKAHIFEPFFTTKEPGRGTGLGLATVHGIVKQSSGHIWLYSEPEQGTTFKIYLPRVESTVGTVLSPPVPIEALNGSETIMLVEDEAQVQDLTRRILEQAGYTVVTARQGQAALHLAQQSTAPFHLLVTDVILPGGMNGQQLAEAVTAVRPGIKVLYISGYTNNVIMRHGVLDPDKEFLEKPFTPEALRRKVRAVLDA